MKIRYWNRRQKEWSGFRARGGVNLEEKVTRHLNQVHFGTKRSLEK